MIFKQPFKGNEAVPLLALQNGLTDDVEKLS